MPKDVFEKEKWNAYMRTYRSKKPEVNKKNCQENYQKHKADRAEYQRNYRKKRREMANELKKTESPRNITTNETEERI